MIGLTRATTKIKRVVQSRFPAALSQLHVFTSSFDWFTEPCYPAKQATILVYRKTLAVILKFSSSGGLERERTFYQESG